MVKNRFIFLILIFCFLEAACKFDSQKELPLYEITNEVLKTQLCNYIDSIDLPNVKEKMPIVIINHSGNMAFSCTIKYATSVTQLLDSSLVIFAKLNEHLVAFKYNEINPRKTIKLSNSLVWEYLKQIFKTEYKDYINYQKIHSPEITGIAWEIKTVNHKLVEKKTVKFFQPECNVFYEKISSNKKLLLENNLIYYEISNAILGQRLLQYVDNVITPEVPQRMLHVDVSRGLQDTTIIAISYATYCPVLSPHNGTLLYACFNNQIVSFLFNDDNSLLWLLKMYFPNISIPMDEYWLYSLLTTEEGLINSNVDYSSLSLPDSISWEYVKEIFPIEYQTRNNEFQEISSFSTKSDTWVLIFKGNELISEYKSKDILEKNN